MAHVNRGRWYVEKGDPQRAIADFTRAINLDSQQNLAYFQRAQVHESLGDVEAAKRTLREGMDAARRSGDEHALSEIEAALALLE